ncbi:ribokinase [Peribacillus huizhouensis]|uniref:Ribokinase n=1 Tax=Peribacillus huizhouensis TaxID=1501239 RepID=A0ABR6CLK5_9BACI|nr:ribokinase [Peribacillus huizhouensis]MBA9025893.1 ribokinase [Peribacillus huizhouensis]
MVKITVIGSSSMDLVVTAQKRPDKGETILGESFKTVPGGKGANQAVAASRLGAEVTMIGRVGDDDFGKEIIKNFSKNNVLTQCVERVTGMESGTAHITLADGDNSIIVVKAANDMVTAEFIEQKLEVIRESDIVLIQQEIPEETVEFVSETCYSLGIPLLLNPAPARPLSQKVIERATYITPNELEAAVLFGSDDIHAALKKYPNKVFITEGKNGVRYHDGEKEVLIPSYQVEVVDTTGAGDTFNAAFAVALAEGKGFSDSVRFANRAASLSVTKFGAQGGMPTREAVEGSL